MEKNTVVELFAGVGGFRLGLETSGWKTIYANQWEPGQKKQWAFDCYNTRFSKGNWTNIDIATIDTKDIPDHTLLCGGFPCQDYSVAATLATSKGIQGKKGVLWWEIRRIAEAKRPKYILLENVDRLLKSPASQRGRDFGIILSCLNALGYAIEWRVINAAEYGFPQRRRRTFIFATKTGVAKRMYTKKLTPADIIGKTGLFAKAFPVLQDINPQLPLIDIPENLVELSKSFSAEFENSGYCRNFLCYTARTTPDYHGPFKFLGDILEKNVDDHYYLKEQDLDKWAYMKGAKREKRITKSGFEYNYAEGPIAYPDYLDRPSRTMLTSESSKNRSTHVVKDPQTGKLRLLTPVECERLDGFPDNWTNTMPEKKRYFCMGNALVVGLIEIIGKEINKI
ncbi:MAG: DNA (cytosine-5-)-methyltransferase [Spirochaetia bacterium]|jgi:DNA (cytosine-5)-methyltransferase 1|nr:DNA (cytosine-5-)-methyltransferase [Spirochaetia bacterium]